MFGLKEAATPKYKVYTALLTQTGESSPADKVQGDSLDEGVTYTIVFNTENADLTVFGAPNSNVGTSFVCTTAGVLPSIGSINLSFDLGAPVVTVLENTIGNIWFTYDGVGSYAIFFQDSFIQNKTTYFVAPPTWDIGGAGVVFAAGFGGGNQIYLVVKPLDGTPIDGILYNTPIEIRVYN